MDTLTLVLAGAVEIFIIAATLPLVYVNPILGTIPLVLTVFMAIRLWQIEKTYKALERELTWH